MLTILFDIRLKFIIRFYYNYIICYLIIIVNTKFNKEYQYLNYVYKCFVESSSNFNCALLWTNLQVRSGRSSRSTCWSPIIPAKTFEIRSALTECNNSDMCGWYLAQKQVIRMAFAWLSLFRISSGGDLCVRASEGYPLYGFLWITKLNTVSIASVYLIISLMRSCVVVGVCRRR